MPKNGNMGANKTKKNYGTERTGRPPKKKKGRKLRKPRITTKSSKKTK